MATDHTRFVGPTPSRITRVVDSLRARALVTKDGVPAGARGNIAVLNGVDLAAMHSAAPHGRRVLDHVPAEAVPALADALHRVTAALITPAR
ncbi:hypothetical protein [Amycolatopsis minnesotensis]|uniref:hypothetical protein n=1 Tax=Amycolatopsis minnesotensis TaxID=337894 RepID=UPI0031CF9E13